MIFGKSVEFNNETEVQQIEREKHNIITNGFQSKILMENPIFHKSVLAMYTNVLNLEDNLDLANPDVDYLQKEYMLQRRMLRSVVTMLDNNMLAMEEQEAERQLEAEEKAAEAAANVNEEGTF